MEPISFTSETKEMVLDFRSNTPPIQTVTISGEDIDIVSAYKYCTWEYIWTLVQLVVVELYFTRKAKVGHIS